MTHPSPRAARVWSTLLQPTRRRDRRGWAAIRLALLSVVLALPSLLVLAVLQPQGALIATQQTTITRQDSAIQEAMDTITNLRAVMEAQRQTIRHLERTCLKTRL